MLKNSAPLTQFFAYMAFSKSISNKIKKNRSHLCLSLIALVSISAENSAWALSGGISGYSGHNGTDCNTCHSGGIAPQVSLSGPTLALPGTTNTYVLSLSGGQNNQAGLGIRASGGTLVNTIAGARLASGEILHASPFNVGNTPTEWRFDWQAPPTAGNYTLYAAVLSTNANGNSVGDKATAVILTIQVSSGEPPPNPQGVPTTQVGGPYQGYAGTAVQFDGSQDNNGTISRFLWDFGDNSEFSQGDKPTHIYTTPGSYTVTLAVTDNDGLTHAAAATVTIDTAIDPELQKYNTYCLNCHGPEGKGGLYQAVLGAPMVMINNAIQNVGEMQNLVIPPVDLQAIANFLTNGGSPRPTTGQGLYDVFCAICHDPGKTGGNVQNSSVKEINEAIAGENWMRHLSSKLSNQEIQLISNHLNGQ